MLRPRAPSDGWWYYRNCFMGRDPKSAKELSATLAVLCFFEFSMNIAVNRGIGLA